MMDIAFIILHYKSYNDTIECIYSIKEKIDTDNYEIFVVDNASRDESIEKVKEKCGNRKITYIINDSNFGFSKGMNVGIKAAKTKDAKYIAIINNDTLLMSNNMFETLEKKNNNKNIALIGPMIITSNGICNCNPITRSVRTDEEAKKLISGHKRRIFILNNHFGFLLYLKDKLNKYLERKNIDLSLSDQNNYRLHGSFMILTDKYFSKFTGLDERIFMYGEESLIQLHILNNECNTLYTPEIVVFHREDASTNAVYSNYKDKMVFESKEKINSLNVYIDIYKGYKKKEDYK